MGLNLNAASLNDVSRALERMLASGMVPSKDLPSSAKEILDAYWLGLRGVDSAALALATDALVRDGAKWLPPANELRRQVWEIERRERAKAHRPVDPVPVDDAVRVSSYDAMGPIGRRYMSGSMAHLPMIGDVKCPVDNCGCEPEEVWVPGNLFGVFTKGWAIRWVWGHVALEQKYKRVKDHPTVPAL